MATDFAEIGGAEHRANPIRLAPRQTKLPQASNPLTPGNRAPAANPIRQAAPPSGPNPLLPAEIPLGSHDVSEHHIVAAAQFASDEGHTRLEYHAVNALVGNLAMEVRRYSDLCRAHQRLLLQAMAMCRYACDGDKSAGVKLYAQVLKEPAHPVGAWLMPYFSAMGPLEQAKAGQEKTISKLARSLPVAAWTKDILGLSDRFVGLIVGECGSPVGEFKSVAAVWKRMGLAVIDGGRQRNICGDAALAHGYVARRRSLMWNVGNSILKAQVRKGEGEDSRVGIGYYGRVYLDRKAYEFTKTDRPIIAHNRAKRYMEKRLLREMFRAWRLAACACDSGSDPQGGDALAAPGGASQSGGAEGAASPTP